MLHVLAVVLVLIVVALVALFCVFAALHGCPESGAAGKSTRGENRRPERPAGECHVTPAAGRVAGVQIAYLNPRNARSATSRASGPAGSMLKLTVMAASPPSDDGPNVYAIFRHV